MKTAKATRRKALRKAKASRKANPKPKTKSKLRVKPRPRVPKMKKKPVRAVRMPTPKTPAKPAIVTAISDAREYARRVFVRFDAESKELVRKVSAGVGLSPYIAHFAAEAAEAGKKLIASPAIGRETGIMIRFESAAVKKMVAGVAGECRVSLSAYCGYFALEAARAGRRMSVSKATTANAAAS